MLGNYYAKLYTRIRGFDYRLRAKCRRHENNANLRTSALPSLFYAIKYGNAKMRLTAFKRRNARYNFGAVF